MRVAFFGASQFGMRCLSTILDMDALEVVGVVTTPKKFSISYSNKPVTNFLHEDFEQYCVQHNLPIHVLRGKMTDDDVVNLIKQWQPDFILVVGWYHLVPRIIRAIPQYGVAGIHSSLLPCYRGGAPLVWSMICGETIVGLSLFQFDDGVDTGPLLAQRSIPVLFNDNIATVYARIEEEGVAMIKEVLPKMAIGDLQVRLQEKLPQGHKAVWPQRSPEDGLIDWKMSAINLYNFIRAQTSPYPGAFTHYRGEKLTIWEAKLFDWFPYKGQAGEVLSIVDEGPLRGILVATNAGDCPLIITCVGFDENTMSGLDFAAHSGLKPGEIFATKVV